MKCRIIYARDLGDEENKRLLPYFPNYTPYRWRDGRLYPLDYWGAGVSPARAGKLPALPG